MEFRAISQVTVLPVYAAIRPMIASNVLCAMYSPLLSGRHELAGRGVEKVVERSVDGHDANTIGALGLSLRR